jgi:hypothetical protein
MSTEASSKYSRGNRESRVNAYWVILVEGRGHRTHVVYNRMPSTRGVNGRLHSHRTVSAKLGIFRGEIGQTTMAINLP